MEAKTLSNKGALEDKTGAVFGVKRCVLRGDENFTYTVGGNVNLQPNPLHFHRIIVTIRDQKQIP